MPFRKGRHTDSEWFKKGSYDIIACDKCGKDIYAAQQYDEDVEIVICLDCYNQLPEGYYKF